MSRFFRGDSDSESSSSSSDSSYNSEDEQPVISTRRPAEAPVANTRFARGAYSSDSESEEDVKRVVRSAKDKRFDQLRSHINKITQALKGNDWALVNSEFDSIVKLIPKFGSTFLTNGQPPRFYIRGLVAIDDAIKEITAKKQKMSNGLHAKALNAMKQKSRKINKDYEEAISAYRANPDKPKAAAAAPAPAPAKKAKKTKPVETPKVEPTPKAAPKAKAGALPSTLTARDIPAALQTILESRGKRGINRHSQLKTIQRLLNVATEPSDIVRILLLSVSVRFDQQAISGGYLRFDVWNLALGDLNRILDTLEAAPEVKVHERAESDPMSEDPKVRNEVLGSIISFVDRLDDEYTKSLQALDPHTTDYLRRLRNQSALYSLIARAQNYFESRQMKESTGRAVMRRIEHLYYKPDQVIATLEARLRESYPNRLHSEIIDYNQAAEPSLLVHQLCAYLYRHGEPLLRTRGIICHIYNHALHDRFHAARDMMLMSHLQENIMGFDIETQVLYNRALVQLGLCAFRQGFVRECHSALQDIFATGRQKELLAQGVHNPRNGVLNPEQELLERQRQLPFHMHINLEMLECVYLTSCMLLEIPAMAQAGGTNDPNARKHIISRVFLRLLDFHERQIFTGPPENTRDHILSASRALAVGDWAKCDQLIRDIRIWDLMSTGSDQIKAMLTDRIKEEGLRTYLFTYAPFYDTMALPTLAAMFSLELSSVYRIISKLIWHEELVASLDRVGELIIFHKIDPSKVQQLSLSFADKVVNLVESNEKLFDQKVTSQNKDENDEEDESAGGKGGRDGKHRGDQRGGRGGGRGGRGGYQRSGHQGRQSNNNNQDGQSRTGYGNRSNRGDQQQGRRNQSGGGNPMGGGRSFDSNRRGGYQARA
ncbi:eukaryotic translation initiation factor 3 subunit 8 N-terminus-domain-containing protein [Dimargaris cristalligena]|uniref:Eukaryotic translation initiation factor 3 subunit C n=1 Tax=Dimargaris cristalligena TaxID=215637 RepID=A0A4P9ZMQ7_9FUNG|nr:eukaryotic translation initiation factor 3 subunit 8 N-terminus-domain-containing protein [Dimargaris cristalligena]|eukprot:RKP34415.1 eukaryotic translation initiation factor 3 subunit 8 N-terminus-domain-containing protein [Dimargaris cristalligena]